MKLYVICGMLALGCACTEVSDPTSGGGVESNVQAVKPGMTESRVGMLLGDHQNEDFDPADGYDSCRSYPYGDLPDLRYVIVMYYDQRVVSATDNHDEPCNFGGDVLD